MKRRKNIEDKSEGHLKIIKGKTGIQSQIDLFNEDLSLEAVALLKEIKDIGDNVDYDKILFTGGSKKVYGFKNFRMLEMLFKDIYNRNMTIDEVNKKNEFAEKIGELRTYQARGSKYIDLQESVSKNTNNFYDGWEKIVYGFKNGILPLSKKDDMKSDRRVISTTRYFRHKWRD